MAKSNDTKQGRGGGTTGSQAKNAGSSQSRSGSGSSRSGDMSVREAGSKGGQRVSELVEKGKQSEGDR